MTRPTAPDASASARPAGRSDLDAGGAAPLHPLALEALRQASVEGWSNPERLHSEARTAATLLGAARETFAALVGARTQEVHLTPSHVASLHAAVTAVAPARRRVGRGVVASAVERAAVLAAARHVAGDDGVTLVPTDQLGRVDALAMADAVAQPGVGLACLQHANGEVGTVQPLAAVHEAARAARVPLLVDAGASLGHTHVPSTWDVLAADPADWGAPRGVGLLVVRQGVRVAQTGPEDADPWAPGGVNVANAFAAAVVLKAVMAERQETAARLSVLVDRLRDEVPRLVPDVEVVGDPDERLPHVLTFSCLYVDGEALLTELDRHGFAVGSGSACTSLTLEPSHVLRAMGVLTHGNVRLTLHPGITSDDVDRFLAVLPGCVARVRDQLGVRGL